MGEVIPFISPDMQVETFVPPTLGEGEQALWNILTDPSLTESTRLPFLEQELIERGVPRHALQGAFPLKPLAVFSGTPVFNSNHRDQAFTWRMRETAFDCAMPEPPEAYYEFVEMSTRREMDGDLVCFIRPLCKLDGTEIAEIGEISSTTLLPVHFTQLNPLLDIAPLTLFALDELMYPEETL